MVRSELEQRLGVLAVSAQDGGGAVNIVDAVFLEPCQHLVNGMPGFMRVVILVLDPDFGLAGIADALADYIIYVAAGDTDDLGAQPGGTEPADAGHPGAGTL